MTLIEKTKECTKINTSNKTLCFTYNEQNNGSVLVGVYHKWHRQIFFLLFEETDNEISIYLLNNYNNEHEFFYKDSNCELIRKQILKLLCEMYPAEKSKKSKKYCYPKQ